MVMADSAEDSQLHYKLNLTVGNSPLLALLTLPKIGKKHNLIVASYPPFQPRPTSPFKL